MPFTRGTAAVLTTVKGNDMATILRIAAAPGTEATGNTAAGYAISVSHNAAAMLQPHYVALLQVMLSSQLQCSCYPVHGRSSSLNTYAGHASQAEQNVVAWHAQQPAVLQLLYKARHPA